MSSPPSDLTAMRLVWLLASVLGAGLALWSDQGAMRSSEWLALGCLALWCLIETTIRRNWVAMLTIPAMMLGIGCALPLYLFFRSRRIA